MYEPFVPAHQALSEKWSHVKGKNFLLGILEGRQNNLEAADIPENVFISLKV